MTGVRFEISGAEVTLGVIARTVAKTDDARGLYDAIGGSLVASTQKRFEDEEDPTGTPWPDSLRKILLGGKTLSVRGGAGGLLGSLTHEASATGVAVGSNAIHAAIHQLGGVIRAKTAKGLRFRAPGKGGWVRKMAVTIPARPYLGLSGDDEQEIAALCADWLGAVNDAG